MQSKLGFCYKKAATVFIVAAGLVASASYAQDVFSQPDDSFAGRVSFGARNPVYAGTKVAVEGQNFKPGQTVTVERGQTRLNATSYTVAENGEFKGEIDIPKDAVIGIHPIVVTVENPDAAMVVDMKISPQVPVQNADHYDVSVVKPAAGLYQSAYSAKTNMLFVSAAVGRPPVKDASLIKIDADTMQVAAVIAPAEANEKSGRFAPYGIGVDDQHGTVWVTNTRQSTLAVYKQEDLSLVKQFEENVLPGGRDVVVDEALNRVYISSPRGSEIYVFDTEKMELLTKIDIRSTQPRATFNSMSLALDKDAHRLYTVSMTTPEVAVIDTQANAVLNVFAVAGLKGGSGIAIDGKNARIYAVGQRIDGVMILDANSGEVLHKVFTGAGSLNVAFNAVDGLAYVSNRGAGTLTAVDGDGKVVSNLDIGPFVNHAYIDPKGRIFVTNKAQGENDRGDQVTRLIAK